MQLLAAKGFKGEGGGGGGREEETNEFDICMRNLKLSAPSSDLLVSLINSYLEFLHFAFCIFPFTAISRQVEKNAHATIPKGNMGYDQYTLSDTVSVEPTFVPFLGTRKHTSMASCAILSNFFEER